MTSIPHDSLTRARVAAVHEGGHAVAVLSYNIMPTLVDITPGDSPYGPTDGGTQYPAGLGANMRAVIAMSGEIAVSLYVTRSTEPLNLTGSDAETARQAFEEAGGAMDWWAEQVRHSRFVLWSRTDQLMRIAGALLLHGRLSGDDVRRLVEPSPEREPVAA